MKSILEFFLIIVLIISIIIFGFGLQDITPPTASVIDYDYSTFYESVKRRAFLVSDDDSNNILSKNEYNSFLIGFIQTHQFYVDEETQMIYDGKNNMQPIPPELLECYLNGYIKNKPHVKAICVITGNN